MSLDICPICTRHVWGGQRYVGPFTAQRPGYQYAHADCYTQSAHVHTDKVKPKPRSAAARAVFGGR